jgi:hypothetical protein
MIHTDLEPAAIKRHHVVICTGNEVSLTIDSPVWGTIYERYIFRVFFSRRHEKYHCVPIDIFILVFYNKNVPRST